MLNTGVIFHDRPRCKLVCNAVHPKVVQQFQRLSGTSPFNDAISKGHKLLFLFTLNRGYGVRLCYQLAC